MSEKTPDEYEIKAKAGTTITFPLLQRVKLPLKTKGWFFDPNGR